MGMNQVIVRPKRISELVDVAFQCQPLYARAAGELIDCLFQYHPKLAPEDALKSPALVASLFDSVSELGLVQLGSEDSRPAIMLTSSAALACTFRVMARSRFGTSCSYHHNEGAVESGLFRSCSTSIPEYKMLVHSAALRVSAGLPFPAHYRYLVTRPEVKNLFDRVAPGD